MGGACRGGRELTRAAFLSTNPPPHFSDASPAPLDTPSCADPTSHTQSILPPPTHTHTFHAPCLVIAGNFPLGREGKSQPAALPSGHHALIVLFVGLIFLSLGTSVPNHERLPLPDHLFHSLVLPRPFMHEHTERRRGHVHVCTCEGPALM